MASPAPEPGFLDSRLAADTLWLGRWPLCHVLLMKDASWPWLILVPAKPGLREMFELEPLERGILMEEIARASARLCHLTGAEKINVGALGNVVAQLHIHVIARRARNWPEDTRFPAPVWGAGPPRPFDPAHLAAWTAELRHALVLDS